MDFERWPSWEDYEVLYSRFRHSRPESNLVDLVDVKGKMILSLCGGSDKVAQICMDRGANSVFVVDSSKDMAKNIQDDVFYEEYDVTFFLEKYKAQMNDWESVEHNIVPFDVIFCRGAVNYWFNSRSAKQLFDVLSDEGVFIFNTMNKPIGETPVVREYKLQDRLYIEVSYMIGDMIYHVQSCEGYKPHLNMFRWIEPSEYHEQLGRYFDVQEKVDGPTSIYFCEKRLMV